MTLLGFLRLFAQEQGKAVVDPLQRKEKGHDQIGGQENRVARIGGDADGNVTAPGQWVDIIVLDHAVDRDRQAGQDNRVLQPAQLFGPAQMGRSQRGDGHIAEKRVGALQPLIRAKPTDKAGQAKDGADQIRNDQQHHRDKERIAPDLLPDRAPGYRRTFVCRPIR